MNLSKRRLHVASKDLFQKYDTKTARIAGILGVTDSGPVDVEGREDYVWVRLSDSETAPVFNQRVPNTSGLKVWVGYTKERPDLFQVLDVQDMFGTPSWNGVGLHTESHTWPERDTVWVRGEQFLPGLITPYSGTVVSVYPMPHFSDGEWQNPVKHDIDLGLYSPSTGAIWAIVEYGATGTIVVRPGTWVQTPENLSFDLIPAPSGTALGAVALYGQTQIKSTKLYSDIADLRNGYIPSGGGSGISDAPVDGKLYGRKNAAWSEVSGTGGGGLTNPVDHLDFVETPSEASTERRLTWNVDEETLDLGMPNDITQQIGHELFISVKNSSGATIADGAPVMFAGTDGNSGHVLIVEAIADGSMLDEQIVGIMTHEILNGAFGKATVFGKVRGIQTDGDNYGETWADGDLIWVSQTTAGYLTNVEPAFGQKILCAAVVHAHGSNGTLLVRPSWGNCVPRSQQQDTKDPTGWVDPSGIDVSYSSSTRKITLTGDLRYYWQGVLHELTSPWVSDAHADVVGTRYFLYSTDGETFAWSSDVWEFYELMVALVRYETAYKFGLGETHGLMPWQVHRELHETLSAYRVSGGGLVAGTYLENSALDSSTTPSFSALVLADEDIDTAIAAWAQGTYTTLRIGASSVPTFDITASFPFRSSGSYILVNNPTTGAETAAGNNQYVNIYILRLPTTSDTDSQKYRLVCLQPQRTFTSLAAAQAEDTRSLSLGDLTPSVPELVFFERITYVLASGDANTGKCRIATGGISYIYGTRMSQMSATGSGGVQTAENTPFTPTGGISATDVQAALVELDTEKAPLASPALTGDPTAPTPAPGDNDTSIATTAFVNTAIGAKKSVGVMGGHGNGGTIAAGGTAYVVPTISGLDTAGRSYPWPVSGTLKNLYVKLASAQPATGTLVFALWDATNNVSTGIGFTVPAGGSNITYSDTTNTFAFTGGNLISLKIVNNASSASAIIGGCAWSIEMSLV